MQRRRAGPTSWSFFCDDLGYVDLACYGIRRSDSPLGPDGQGWDPLHRFYSTAPVCSPSRVGLLTGRSPNRAGVYDWIPSGREVHMRASEVTIPQLLKKAGYATCMSGKVALVTGSSIPLNTPSLMRPGSIIGSVPRTTRVRLMRIHKTSYATARRSGP